ncbi:transmembrane protein [Cryptosporidium felis]|nr:transmembrane protein [Cryptosporidium felis]
MDPGVGMGTRPQAPLPGIISEAYLSGPWMSPLEHKKWVEKLRDHRLPLGYIPMARRYQRAKESAIIERARQWAEIAAWRFQTDPKYSTGTMKYTIKDFESVFQRFSNFGWSQETCEQVLADMGIHPESAEVWCSNIEPWGHDECADLTWPDFVIVDDIENKFRGKLEQQSICRLVQLVRPSQLENVRYRTVYDVCQQNILALRDPLTLETITQEEAETICKMMDFTMSPECKRVPPRHIHKAQELAIAFGDAVFPRLLDFRVSDACKVVSALKDEESQNLEACRNEMISLLWSRAANMGETVCPWGWDIISQIVEACQEVYKRHSRKAKELEEKAVILTGGFFNPTQTYTTRWWKASPIGQKLAMLLVNEPALSQSLQEGIISPTQLMWAYNIYDEYKSMGNNVYSLVEVVNMVREFNVNEPQISCEAILNSYLGKFENNDENGPRQQFSRIEVRKMCAAMEKQSVEVCRRFLVSPLIGIARDIRSYFLKELKGATLMQLEDICLLVAAINVPKVSPTKGSIQRRCSHAMNKFVLKNVNLTFSQRYGLTSTQQEEICIRMDIWGADSCDKLPLTRRPIIHPFTRKLYDLSSRYGILEYRFDEICKAFDLMGENPPREKCEFILVSEFFGRWMDTSNSLFQLAHHACVSFFERRTSGKELNEIRKALNSIKDFMDEKGEYKLPGAEKTYQQFMDDKIKASKPKSRKYDVMPSLAEGSQVEALPGVLKTLESIESSESPGIEDVRGKYYSALTKVQLEILNRIVSHKPAKDEKKTTVEAFAKVVYKLNQFTVMESCVGQLVDDLEYPLSSAKSICALIDPLQSESCLSAQKIDLTSAKQIHQKMASKSGFSVFINLAHICDLVNYVNILKYVNKVRQGRMRIATPSCRNGIKTILAPKYLVAQSSQMLTQICSILDITADPGFNGGVLKTNYERYSAFKLADSLGHRLELLPKKKVYPITWQLIMGVIRRIKPTPQSKVTRAQCTSAMQSVFGRFRHFGPVEGTEACCLALGCSDFKVSGDFLSPPASNEPSAKDISTFESSGHRPGSPESSQ